jgi:hypothetical protein
MDYSVRTNAFGERISGLVAGVYDDNEHAYAGRANDLWWRGVVIKNNVKDGDYEPEFISIKTMRERYGN